MKLTGTQQEITNQLLSGCPQAKAAIERARASIRFGKANKSILPYQAAALFSLACELRPVRILEIGTYYGFSAAVMAQAAPQASVITLNPIVHEAEAAYRNLAEYPNVSVIVRYSWDYLEMLAPDWKFNMIFVDGDHKQVRRDLPFWNRLTTGGLFLFHDYSPNGSTKACPPVYRALNDFREYLGRDFDVLIVDHEQIGMAGWYKRAEDKSV